MPCALAPLLLLVVDASLPNRMRSDGHFMENDYPSDVRARVTHHHTKYDFDHPYPILQEDHDYDADYVKDENDDGGEFKAQEYYDYLRHAIGKYQAQVDALKAKLEADKNRYEELKAKEARSEAAAKAAAAEYEAAKSGAYDQKVEDLKAQIAEAQGAVNRESQELEDCRKELLDAKHVLERELKRHRAEVQAADARAAAATGGAPAVSAPDAASDPVGAAEAVEDEAEQGVEAEKGPLRAAQAAYDAALAKVKRTEALLEEAAAKLKVFRDGEDPNGGVYNVNALAKAKDKASALRRATPGVFVLASLMALAGPSLA